MCRRSSLLDPRIYWNSFAERGVLDGFEKRHGDCDLVGERGVLGALERDDEEIGRHEDAFLCAGDPDGGAEYRGVELSAGEGDEDPGSPDSSSHRVTAVALCDQCGAQHECERGERDDGGDHGTSLSRSVRSVMTRMSRPGNSRTMRERSEPPRISRLRDSSGVPTKT